MNLKQLFFKSSAACLLLVRCYQAVEIVSPFEKKALGRKFEKRSVAITFHFYKGYFVCMFPPEILTCQCIAFIGNDHMLLSLCFDY